MFPHDFLPYVKHEYLSVSKQNFLGALDGTFVPVMPLAEDRARYRSRKGDYAINVLGVCSRGLQFIYALSGWEGSATDSRVLRNQPTQVTVLKHLHQQVTAKFGFL